MEVCKKCKAELLGIKIHKSQTYPNQRNNGGNNFCRVCGLMNSNITRHMRDIHLQTYVGEGEFQCQIVNCRSRFSSRLGLVRHLRGNRHAGEPEAKAMARSFDRRRKTLPIVSLAKYI